MLINSYCYCIRQMKTINFEVWSLYALLSIHSDFDISECLQTVCTVCIPESCGWRGIQLLHLKNASKSAVFWCYCKPFSIHSFLVLLSLPTLEHTAILWLGGLVLKWSKLSIWGYAPKKMLKLTSPERSLSVNRVKSESNPSLSQRSESLFSGLFSSMT
jgi:hypothetical protein